MINSDNAIRPLGTGKYSITFAQYEMKLRKKCLALKEDLSSKSEREFSRWCSNLTWKIVPSGDGRVLGAKGAQIFRLARDSGPLLDVREVATPTTVVRVPFASREIWFKTPRRYGRQALTPTRGRIASWNGG
jgi:hypothetical protein